MIKPTRKLLHGIQVFARYEITSDSKKNSRRNKVNESAICLVVKLHDHFSSQPDHSQSTNYGQIRTKIATCIWSFTSSYSRKINSQPIVSRLCKYLTGGYVLKGEDRSKLTLCNLCTKSSGIDTVSSFALNTSILGSFAQRRF